MSKIEFKVDFIFAPEREAESVALPARNRRTDHAHSVRSGKNGNQQRCYVIAYGMHGHLGSMV
jgi:hypothetical protein